MKKNSTEMELADPDSNMSPSEVMDFYSMTYPFVPMVVLNR